METDKSVNSYWKTIFETYRSTEIPKQPVEIINYIKAMEPLYISGQLKYNSAAKIKDRLEFVEKRVKCLLSVLVMVTESINKYQNLAPDTFVSEIDIRLRYIKNEITDIETFVLDKVHSNPDAIDFYDCHIYVTQQLKRCHELQIKYFKSLFNAVKNSKRIKQTNKKIGSLSSTLTTVNLSKIREIKTMEKKFSKVIPIESYIPNHKKHTQEHLKRLLLLNKLEFTRLMSKETKKLSKHIDFILDTHIVMDQTINEVVKKYVSGQKISGSDLYQKNNLNKIAADISPEFARIQFVETLINGLYQNKIQPAFLWDEKPLDISSIDIQDLPKVPKDDLEMVVTPILDLHTVYNSRVGKILHLIKEEQVIQKEYAEPPDNLFIESMVYNKIMELSNLRADIKIDVEQIRYITFGVTKIISTLSWNAIDNIYGSNTGRDFNNCSLALLKKINEAILLSKGVENSEIQLSDSTLLKAPTGMLEAYFCPHYMEAGLFLVISRDPIRKVVTMKLIPGCNYDGFTTVDIVTELNISSKNKSGVSTDSSSATKFCLGLMKLANLSFFLCNVKCKKKQEAREFEKDEIEFIERMIQLIKARVIKIPDLIKMSKLEYNGKIYDVREIVENIGAYPVNFILDIYSTDSDDKKEKIKEKQKIKHCINALFGMRESINNIIKNVFEFILIDCESFYGAELLIQILQLIINTVVLDAEKNKYKLSYKSIKSVAFHREQFEKVTEILKPPIENIIEDLLEKNKGRIHISKIQSTLAEHYINRDVRTIELILQKLNLRYVEKQKSWFRESEYQSLLKQDMSIIMDEIAKIKKNGKRGKSINEIGAKLSASLTVIGRNKFRELYTQTP